MEDNIRKLIIGLRVKAGVSEEALVEVQSTLGLRFPKEYSDFLLFSNGAEGSIGKSYLSIWPLEDITTLNKAYAVNEFAPGLILFGSDGGETGYAFDTRSKSMPIVAVPFIGMDLSEIIFYSQSFNEFLKYLSELA
jgi:hypothetical protein